MLKFMLCAFAMALFFMAVPTLSQIQLPTIGNLALINTNRFPQAICLDGTPGGRYQLLSNNTAHSHQVHLHLAGGAWATTPKDAYQRSLGALGSSSSWAPTLNFAPYGILNPNCDSNPNLCNLSQFYLQYCDGMSMGGTAQVDYQGHTLYMYGDYVLRAQLTEIFEIVLANMKRTGNTKRPEVVLSGCSAGGLASLANTWKVEQMAKSILGPQSIISTIPCSGIFPNTNNVNGQENYPMWMKDGFELAKPLFSPDDSTKTPCLQQRGPSDQWKCMFGETHLSTIQTPVFVINSVIDSWSLPCIYGSAPPLSCSAVPEWSSCVGSLTNCTAPQVQKLKDQWIPRFLQAAGRDSTQFVDTVLGATTFINSQVGQGNTTTYYNLATQVAWEQNKSMFAYTHPESNRVQIEPVPNNVDQVIAQQINGRNGLMSQENFNLVKDLQSQRYNPSVPTPASGFSLPPGSGAFLHTCGFHCEGSSSRANKFAIDGVTIATAVDRWYTDRIAKAYAEDKMTSPIDSNSAFGSNTPHVYLPCTLTSGSGQTAQCNPTC